MLNPDSSLGEVGERALLKHIRSRIPLGPGVVVGVGDDAAAVQTAALTLVTTDTLVEGAHFRRDWTPPQLLGRKALTISLSDIAAMAGIPRYATVSLCLPPDLPLRFVDELYDGLLERAAETGVSLIGGNLAACREAISIEVMVLGQGDKLLRRSGAQSGDLAVVTGTLGASAAGLRLLKQGARLGAEGGLEATGIWTESSAPGLTHCLMAHLDPSPPLAFARALSEHELVHAAMDISDGLSGDLLHLCEESSVAAWLDPAALPIDPWAARVERARGGDSLALALHGGEDYQLLLAVPPDRLDALKDVAVVWDLPLAAVGQFTEGEPAVSIRNGELVQPLEVAGFDHFRTAAAERRASPEAGA